MLIKSVKIKFKDLKGRHIYVTASIGSRMKKKETEDFYRAIIEEDFYLAIELRNFGDVAKFKIIDSPNDIGLLMELWIGKLKGRMIGYHGLKSDFDYPSFFRSIERGEYGADFISIIMQLEGTSHEAEADVAFLRKMYRQGNDTTKEAFQEFRNHIMSKKNG